MKPTDKRLSPGSFISPGNRHIFISIVLFSLSSATSFSETPKNLLCEWEINPKAVHDPCPEFYWETPSQSAFRIAVAVTADGFDKPVWDITRKSKLPITEYNGPALMNEHTYYWKVWVFDKDGNKYDEPVVQQFTFKYRPMPHFLPSVRTFVNFAGNPEWAKDKIDLCFRKEAKKGRQDILATQYALICTMVIPSKKADDLQKFCEEHGYKFEECFCHFATDTHVTLHVGAELAKNPREKRLCPGWDPKNDRNNDGKVDDSEFKTLINANATAHEMKQARIPIYFWGPPRDDYVMNVGHAGYQEFMAKVHAPEMAEGWDGLYFDTVPTDVASAGRTNPVFEYPRQGDDADKWMRDVQIMFAKMKINMPGKIITANCWGTDPMVIEGFQSEGWMNITHQLSKWKKDIDEMLAYDKRGKIQLIQYNPIYDKELAEFGHKVDGVSCERDKIYGLASYLLAHGNFSYFGFGSHPYAKVTQQWFKAIEFDIGRPMNDYHLVSEKETSTITDRTNLLKNGGFESADKNGKPAEWKPAQPVDLDSVTCHGGQSSSRITSTSKQNNNLNNQYVKLKQQTTYTLTVWIKTENVTGTPGAQIYPYEFDGATGAGPAITLTGSTDWKRYRQVFTTANDGDGRITFRMFGATGTAWFDDIELVEGAIFANTVYAREFTKGLVLVKPYTGGSYGDETASKIELPAEMCPLNVDGSIGTPVKDIRLRNGEAAILVLNLKRGKETGLY
ncbi:MAG: putative glycoside hydrolase [Kiritimatiellae bacterium]|nr:putative glycoside hydrolase [Kiritimatiellia bacterium]MDD5521054.1 putative glycoside hydrolase [Kiritimatiellia bacterium]